MASPATNWKLLSMQNWRCDEMAKRGKSFQLQPEHPCVILCEGKDEDMFLRYYIKYLVEKNLV